MRPIYLDFHTKRKTSPNTFLAFLPKANETPQQKTKVGDYSSLRKFFCGRKVFNFFLLIRAELVLNISAQHKIKVDLLDDFFCLKWESSDWLYQTQISHELPTMRGLDTQEPHRFRGFFEATVWKFAALFSEAHFFSLEKFPFAVFNQRHALIYLLVENETIFPKMSRNSTPTFTVNQTLILKVFLWRK